MKNNIKFILIIALLMSIYACSGNKKIAKQSLYFIDHSDKDTADFIHYQFDDYPFSIELMGSPELVNDSLYKIQFQIGTYEHPFFEIGNLRLYSDSVSINIYGIEPSANYSILKFPYEREPWIGLSMHTFGFRKKDLDSLLLKRLILEFEINMDKYATYNNQPVKIEPIKVLDPWFEKYRVEK